MADGRREPTDVPACRRATFCGRAGGVRVVRRVLAVGAVLALGGLGLGACQSGDGTPPPEGAGEQERLGGFPEAKRWIDRPEMPLDYYFALVNQANLRPVELASATGGEWEAKQEEDIAECMKGEGFEYYPKDIAPAADGPSDIAGGAPSTLQVPWLPDDLALVEQYGYGRLSPNTTEWPGASQADPEASPAPDPNADYAESLSPQARHEYDVALMGAEFAAYDLADYETVAAPEMGGCMGRAWEAHPYPALVALGEPPVETTYKGLIELLWDLADPYERSAEGYLEEGSLRQQRLMLLTLSGWSVSSGRDRIMWQ
ncbi:MAG: hypothetical protein LBJ02_08420 [Bifidobacteriaceae bacterium]|jgi:hypothetical protein|nr:hypothetical protein [Bifidobacteriaceae bacterium]